MRVPNRLLGVRGWLLTALFMGMVVAACSSKKTTAASSASATKRTPTDAIAKLPIADIQAPDDIMYFGAIDDVAKLAPSYAPVADALQRPGDLRKKLSDIATEDLGLESDHGLELTKSVRIAVLDVRKHGPRSLIYLFPVESEEALITTTPSNRTMGDKWNAYDWSTPNGRVYLNLVGGIAVFTREPNGFIEDQSFLEELAVATLPSGAILTARGRALANISSYELPRLWSVISKGASKTSGRGQASALLQRFPELLSEVDSVSLLAKPSDAGWVFTFAVAARPKTGTQAAFESLEGMHLNTLLPRFPMNALAYFSGSLSPSVIRLVDAAMKRKREKKAPTDLIGKVNDAWLEMLAASTGDFLFGIFPLHNEPAMVLMSSLADGEGARAGLGAMQDAYQNPGAIADLAKAGVKTTVRPNAYHAGPFGVSIFKTEAVPGHKTLFDPNSPLLEMHTLVGSDETVFAFGAHASEIIKTLSDPKSLKDPAPLGLDKTDGFVRVAKSGAPSPFIIGYLSPTMLAIPERLDLPDTGGVIVTAGSKDGILEIDLDLPTAQVAPAVAVINEFARGGNRKQDPKTKH